MRAREFIVEYKTEEYNGLRFSTDIKNGQLIVRALDDWGTNELGHVVFNIGDNDELDPQDLEVDERYQGQGVASTMYDYVKTLGYEIHRSWDQTPAGAGFWNKHRGEDVRVWEGVDADQVLDYVKRTHAPEQFDIEYSITDHPRWELKNIPLSRLKLDPDGEERDPYNRVNWVDYDTVNELMPKIASVLKSKPIVVDSQGWIIDGNHRATAAAEAGLKSVPAYVPADLDEGVKSRLAQAALAGGLALGAGSANAMDWKDAAMTGAMFVPGIGQAVKAYNVGKSLYQAGTAAKQYRDLDKELTALAAKNKAENPRGPTTVTYDPDNADKFDPVDENFADGKIKGKSRPGRVKRAGASCDGSVSSLRAKAKKYGGEKGKMYHWCANMKGGKKK